MEIPLGIRIIYDDSALSRESQLELRYWVENVVFARFGRSPCHSYLESDGKTKTYNYAVSVEEKCTPS
jgi:hypothetical protein